jgi:hypothetical protein
MSERRAFAGSRIGRFREREAPRDVPHDVRTGKKNDAVKAGNSSRIEKLVG